MEALVATALGLVVVGVFASFNISQMYNMRNQSNQVDLQTSARAVVDLFAREVRRAGRGTNVACTGTVSTGLLLAQGSQIRFRADLDSNGALNGANEDITYTLDSNAGRVTRTDNSIPRTDTLWTGAGITGSQITYFDGTNNVLTPSSTGLNAAQLLQVRRVRLQLSLAGNVSQPGNTMQQNAMEAVEVALRNRYFVTAASCAYN